MALSCARVCDSCVVDGERRRRLAREALDGYFSGPDAQLAATTTALAKIDSARCVVLVEGISDQIALDALAARRGRDLGAEGILIIPVGGAHAITRYLVRFGPEGAGLAVTGMCDAGEENMVRRALALSGFGHPQNRADMEALGFFVCVKDLEDELIRASGRHAIELLLASQGDLRSFQTLQQQPGWREQTFDAQMHRWLRAGARRNLRYARLLIAGADSDQIPQPLEALMTTTADLTRQHVVGGVLVSEGRTSTT